MLLLQQNFSLIKYIILTIELWLCFVFYAGHLSLYYA